MLTVTVQSKSNLLALAFSPHPYTSTSNFRGAENPRLEYNSRRRRRRRSYQIPRLWIWYTWWMFFKAELLDFVHPAVDPHSRILSSIKNYLDGEKCALTSVESLCVSILCSYITIVTRLPACSTVQVLPAPFHPPTSICWYKQISCL